MLIDNINWIQGIFLKTLFWNPEIFLFEIKIFHLLKISCNWCLKFDNRHVCFVFHFLVSRSCSDHQGKMLLLFCCLSGILSHVTPPISPVHHLAFLSFWSFNIIVTIVAFLSFWSFLVFLMCLTSRHSYSSHYLHLTSEISLLAITTY